MNRKHYTALVLVLGVTASVPSLGNAAMEKRTQESSTASKDRDFHDINEGLDKASEVLDKASEDLDKASEGLDKASEGLDASEKLNKTSQAYNNRANPSKDGTSKNMSNDPIKVLDIRPGQTLYSGTSGIYVR